MQLDPIWIEHASVVSASQVSLCKEVLNITKYEDAVKLALAVVNLHRILAALLRLAPASDRRVTLNVPMTRRWVCMQCYSCHKHTLRLVAAPSSETQLFSGMHCLLFLCSCMPDHWQ